MKRSLALIAVLGLLGPAAGADLVTIGGGAVHHLYPEAERAAVRIPVQAAESVPFGELQFELVSVRRGRDATPALLERVRLRSMPVTAAHVASLVVSVDPAFAAGTYDLRVNVHRSSTGDVQPLDLQLVRPAAQLSTPGTLKVMRVLPFLAFEGETSKQHFVLRETSKHSAVTDLGIVQASANAPDGGPVAGEITFEAPTGIPPGGRSRVAYALTGDFGLGSASVKASLNAPQLANVLEFDLSVDTRRHPAWVVLVLTGGLVMGYLLRTHLQSVIELGTAKEQARRALDELEEAVRGRADPRFRASLDRVVERLQAAVNRGDPTTIAAISGEIAGEIEGTVTDLRAREVEVRDQLDGLLALVTKRWTLPPAVAAAMSRGRETVGDVDAGFDPGDPEPTRKACVATRSDLHEEVRSAMGPWHAASCRVLLGWRTSRGALVVRLLAERNELEAMEEALEAVPATDPEAELDDLVRKIHAAYVLQLDAFKELAELLRVVLERWARELAELGAQSDELRWEVRALWQEVDKASGDPIATADVLLAGADSLHRSLETAIRRASPDEGDVQLNELLGAGQYDDAIARARQLRRERAAAEGVPLGEADAETLRAAEFGLAPPPERERVAPGRGSVSRRGAPWPGLRVQLDRGRTMPELMRAKFLQTSLYGVLILFGGYVLFSGSFVGTTDDFARIFFWAFGIDVGAGAVTSLATQVKANR